MEEIGSEHLPIAARVPKGPAEYRNVKSGRRRVQVVVGERRHEPALVHQPEPGRDEPDESGCRLLELRRAQEAECQHRRHEQQRARVHHSREASEAARDAERGAAVREPDDRNERHPREEAPGTRAVEAHVLRVVGAHEQGHRDGRQRRQGSPSAHEDPGEHQPRRHPQCAQNERECDVRSDPDPPERGEWECLEGAPVQLTRVVRTAHDAGAPLARRVPKNGLVLDDVVASEPKRDQQLVDQGDRRERCHHPDQRSPLRIPSGDGDRVCGPSVLRLGSGLDRPAGGCIQGANDTSIRCATYGRRSPRPPAARAA